MWNNDTRSVGQFAWLTGLGLPVVFTARRWADFPTIGMYGRDTSFGRTKVRDAHRVPVGEPRSSDCGSLSRGLSCSISCRRCEDARTRLRSAVRTSLRDITLVDPIQQDPVEALLHSRVKADQPYHVRVAIT